jgi:hypothetical protein
MSIAALLDTQKAELLNMWVPRKPAKPQRKQRTPLTAENKAESSRLRAIWDENRKTHGFKSQDALAEAIGVTQGMIAQWFGAKQAAMSDWHLVKLGYRMKFDPRRVRPRIYETSPELAPDSRLDDLADPPELLEVFERMRLLEPDQIRSLADFLDRFT